MNKKISVWLIMLTGTIILLSACGEKSQEAVVNKLDKTLKDLDGYKVEADMTMNTGQEEQSYDIDVWYQKDDNYRVSLSNEQDEKGNQIILKNEDGVFVLTPSLNKSFKFQTEWPDNSSQPYLLQSIVKDIKNDEGAEFIANDNDYVFTTKTNYQSNSNLPYQEIHIDKKDYTPTMVKVLDKDKQALVEVEFSEFAMDPPFEDKDFVLDENMKADSDVAETGATGESNEQEEDESAEQEEETPLQVLLPEDLDDAELVEKKQVDLEDGERVILDYDGDKSFTLILEKREGLPELTSPQEVHGDIVNLGFTVGALTTQGVEWNYEGTDFQLASEELTREELIGVAQSVGRQEVK